jgi:hypothetical protein
VFQRRQRVYYVLPEVGIVKQLPYGVQTDKKIIHEAEHWCVNQWGPRWEAVGNREGTWCLFWGGSRVENSPSMYQWWFESEQQRMWFLLRWGEYEVRNQEFV